MSETHWSRATLESRIADAKSRQRHAGGSPDSTEIEAYASGLSDVPEGTAAVLGMTPELRSLALSRFRRVVSVDKNSDSIAVYRDWIPEQDRARETVIAGDWFHLRELLRTPMQAVLADGVFGNLPDLPAHARLLESISAALAPGGRFVTRMALIPEQFNPAEYSADRLLAQFRAGELDEAEFGFGMRLVGHHALFYDTSRHLLDNARLFAHCADRHRRGEILDVEWRAIQRYYFGGFNCIAPQSEWERVLTEGGWRWEIRRCTGKSWYAYYPVYVCSK